MTSVSLVKPPAGGPPPAPPRPAPAWVPYLDLGLRILGFVVALLLAAVSAAYEAFLAPLYWGSTRIPVAAVLAVLANVALAQFAVVVTGRRLAALGPALVWVALMVVASSRTTEGDLVLTGNNWVGITTMIAGSVAFGVVGYRLVLADRGTSKYGPGSGARASDRVEGIS